MSLRWFRSFVGDELRIFVHPDYILLAHLKRRFSVGFKPRLMQQQVLSVDFSEPSHQWQPLKNCLTDAIHSDTWQHVVKQGIRANVVISSHFARYAVIPWSADLAVESERQAFMRYRFNVLFGDAVKNWDLRMDAPDFGHPTIASGMETKLIATLHEVLNTAHINIKSISPYLMLAINQSVTQIKHLNTQDFWFAVMESGRLCFVLIENGAWHLIKNVAMESDISEQIHTLIQREMVNRNISSTLSVVIYQADSSTEAVIKVADFPIIRIPHNAEPNVDSSETSANAWLAAKA